MNSFELKTPVAFFIFNRPSTTKMVFEEIRKVRPQRLLVVADGPRDIMPDDSKKCKIARDIVERVDWSCDVSTNYSNINLGCKQRVYSGLNWVFDNVEEAIILEDDCLPHPTFFRFCEELLIKYRNDERIMTISGNNFQFGKQRTRYSYYFSKYLHIWGWATWKRSWAKYDLSMSLWPEISSGGWLNDIFSREKVVKYWRNAFEDTYNGLIDTWDCQFFLSCLVNNGLNILPNCNLVSNIGFGLDATRTKRKNIFSAMAINEMHFPLIEPPYIIKDAIADFRTEDNQFSIHHLMDKIKYKIKTFNYRLSSNFLNKEQVR